MKSKEMRILTEQNKNYVSELDKRKLIRLYQLIEERALIGKDFLLVDKVTKYQKRNLIEEGFKVKTFIFSNEVEISW